MFRLEDRQLHILTGLLAVASVLLFLVFGISKMPKAQLLFEKKGMADFSEAWVCTYKTEDEAKLKANPVSKDVAVTGRGRYITEIMNLPAEFPVMEGEALTLSHKVPEINMDTVYLTFQTKGQKVKVSAEQDVLYESPKSDILLKSLHVVPIPREYKDKVLTIELISENGKAVQISDVQEGRYNELLMQAFLNNGGLFVTGCIFLLISICLLVVWLLAKSGARQKRLLLYSSMEGILAGLLFLAESHIVQLFVNWNYGLYYAKTCLLLLLSVFHLMIIRLFVYKKTILFSVDMGILFYGIFYVSVMVLQAFSLLHFDGIYLSEKILFVMMTCLYTALLLASMSGHARKDGKTVFIANILLLFCILTPFLMRIFGRQQAAGDIYICIGCFIYMVFLWFYGVKLSFYVQMAKETVSYKKEDVRAEVIEQVNPNLMFMAFQTLQTMIKNGSANSVKMIYYISVYFKDNLKALEHGGEIIPFEEELEHMIAYLQLQKTRNSNFSFSMECKVKDFVIPRYSIEPMVEKAVKYGITGNNNKGNVVVRTYERKDGYAVQIIDDGAGFDTGKLKKKGSTSLLSLFADLEKKCNATTEVISKEGKGTVITIILPMLDNDLIEEN